MPSNTESKLVARNACLENSLRPLLKETFRIDPEMRVESLRRRFETLGSIASAVVVRQDRPVGLIMSHRMDRLLSSQFGYSLHFRKPVTAIMDPAPLVIETQTVLEQAASEAMARPKDKVYDHIVITDQGKLIGVVSVRRLLSRLADLAAQRADELAEENRERRQSEEKYRLVVENAHDGIFVAQDSVIRLTNRRIEQILGRSAQELECIPFADTIHPEDRQMVIERHNRRITRQEGPDDCSFRVLDSGGQVVWVQLNAVPIQWEGRAATLNFVRDITRTKQLEAQLMQAQKMEAIGTLAGGIAHDFNNILAAILGYAEMSLLETDLSRPITHRLHRILEAARRARDLVSRILAFSRQQADEVRPVSVETILKETLHLIRASAPAAIEINSRIDPDCGAVMADPTRIHQVIMNLCTNAVHAMEACGGCLDVRLEPVDVDASAAGRHLKLKVGPYLRLGVTDSGCGMAPEVVARIFDPYFTTQTQGRGTGLGLAMVHGIVERMGGSIHVYSEPGRGTTFQVYFPRLDRHAETPVETKAPLPTGCERILLVEDEPTVLEMMSETLSSLGYRVEGQTGPVEAMLAFRIDSQRFDLVITDMNMPRKNGRELASELLALRPDLPIIMCTGFSALLDDEAVAAAGIRAILLKPVLMQDMATTVRRVLDQDPMGSSACLEEGSLRPGGRP